MIIAPINSIESADNDPATEYSLQDIENAVNLYTRKDNIRNLELGVDMKKFSFDIMNVKDGRTLGLICKMHHVTCYVRAFNLLIFHRSKIQVVEIRSN